MYYLGDEPGLYRVWRPDQEAPGLAMSRAFGDYCVKDHGVISTPEVTQRRITARDQFVILATDGVIKLLLLFLNFGCHSMAIGWFAFVHHLMNEW